MTLDQFLIDAELTNGQFAEMVGVHGVSIGRYRLAGRIPAADVMRRIYDATNGKVTANDFFEIKARRRK